MAGMLDKVKSILPERLGGTSGLPFIEGTDPPQRGDTQILEMYSKSPWLRAVTNKIGREVAKTDWQLFVPRDNNGRAVNSQSFSYNNPDLRSKELHREFDLNNVTQIKDNPLLYLLNNGNEAMSGLVAMQVTQLHLDLLGEAFWLLERNNAGVPIAYWPLPPTWVRDIPNRERMSYIISAQGHRSGEVEIPIREIIHFRDPDPKNPYSRGTGVARALGDEIEIDEFSGKHVKNTFWNRARPDLVITGDSFKKEDAERVEQKWKENHQGFWSAAKPMFINREVTIKELGQSFESMQLTNLRQYERDSIISVFGVPPEKLGLISSSNRSTIEESDRIFMKDVIVPRVELIRVEIQRQLVSQFDSRLILHYISPVKEDKEFQLQIMKAAPWAHTANDWRNLSGFEEFDNDFLLIERNTMRVPVDSPLPAGPPEDEEGEEGQQNNAVLPASRKAIEKQVKHRIAKKLALRSKTVH